MAGWPLGKTAAALGVYLAGSGVFLGTAKAKKEAGSMVRLSAKRQRREG